MDFTPTRSTFSQSLFLTSMMRVMFRPVFGWKDASVASPQSFVIDGIDGSRLEAALFKTDLPSHKGIIVLCHPFMKYGMSYFSKNKFAESLTNLGYHVVTFNFKGFGRSSIGGPCFADDVISAVKWASGEFPQSHIHLLGFSFGGYNAIHALARMDGFVKSAVFDSVPPFLGNFFHKGAIGATMRHLGNSRLKVLSGTAPIEYSLTKIHRTPMLLIFGDSDAYCSDIEQANIEKIGNFSVKTFSNAYHLEAQKKYREEYLRYIAEFL